MLVFLNNKSSLGLDEFKKYKSDLEKIKTNHEVVLMPCMIYLGMSSSSKYILGSQDVSRFEGGSHTARVSVSQLKDLGIKYCLVGHSEVRWELSETNEAINDKIKLLLENDIIPVLCVGELEEEKGVRDLVIVRQLKLALLNISDSEKEKIVVAYEPRWAIGSGIMPVAEKIDEVVDLIKKELPKNKVVYGGSVNMNTIEEVERSNIDGVLIGSAGCKIDELKSILDRLH